MDFNDDENIEWLMESAKTVDDLVEDDVACELGERESFELCEFLGLLRSVFDSEPVLFASKASGSLKSEEDIQRLLKKLQAFGYFYSVRTSIKRPKAIAKLKIMQKKTPPSSHPYRVNSYVQYYCSLGRRSKRKKTAGDGQGAEGAEIAQLDQPVDKCKECKAIMDIRELEIFTTVDIPPSKRGKSEALQKLRRQLYNQCNEPGTMKYSISISLPKIHNHPRAITGQQINEEVKAALHSIVRKGAKTVPQIQEDLMRLVEKDFAQETVKPSKDNSAFYPSQKVIYNHVKGDGLVRRKVHLKNMRLEAVRKDISEGVAVVLKKMRRCRDLTTLARTLDKVNEIQELLMDIPLLLKDNKTQEEGLHNVPVLLNETKEVNELQKAI